MPNTSSNPNALNFSAHPNTTREVEGEIVPSYATNTPNGPRYPDANTVPDYQTPKEVYETLAHVALEQVDTEPPSKEASVEKARKAIGDVRLKVGSTKHIDTANTKIYVKNREEILGDGKS